MEKILEIVKSLLAKLGINDAEVTASEDHGAWKVAINSPKEHAQALHDNEKHEALVHLLKRILCKELGEDAKIIIDINGARAKSDEATKMKALIIAGRVREFKVDVEMEPMSSYERMLVHSALQSEKNIKTESVGEGRTRRLVVRYREEE